MDAAVSPIQSRRWQSRLGLSLNRSGRVPSFVLAVAGILSVWLVAIRVCSTWGVALSGTDEAVRFQMLRREEWGYGGIYGPEMWGALFVACKGSQQSPVEIIDADVANYTIRNGVRAMCTDNSRTPPISRTISDVSAFKSCSAADGPRCRPGETCISGMPAVTKRSNVEQQPAQRFAMRWPNAAGLYTEYLTQAQTVQASQTHLLTFLCMRTVVAPSVGRTMYRRHLVHDICSRSRSIGTCSRCELEDNIRGLLVYHDTLPISTALRARGKRTSIST
jgi:hypothetical protein